VKNKIIVKHYAGSISYGTNTPNSDTDFRGIFLGDRESITTPYDYKKEIIDENEEDTKYFELNFFCSLAADMNPNVIETLYVNKKHITETSPEYEYLRENRDMFLNKRIAFSTSSYALQEMRKMKNHNKFINQPELTEFPKQTSFMKLVQNFTPDKVLKNTFNFEDLSYGYKMVSYGNNLFGVIKSEKHKTRTKDFQLVVHRQQEDISEKPEFIVKFNKDEYEQAKIKYKAYNQWLSARENKKRTDMEDAHGYDTKNAMHLVRLMRVGYEAITEGNYNVFREDAKELLEIRNGAWSYEQLVEYAEKMDIKIQMALKETKLPEKPDFERIKKVIVDIQNSGWGLGSKIEYKKDKKPKVGF